MQPYKTLMFGRGEIPSGLLKEHNLKPETWGLLRVVTGAVTYVDASGRTQLAPGDAHVIPPQELHHIEPTEDASIEIGFYRAPPG